MGKKICIKRYILGISLTRKTKLKKILVGYCSGVEWSLLSVLVLQLFFCIYRAFSSSPFFNLNLYLILYLTFYLIFILP